MTPPPVVPLVSVVVPVHDERDHLGACFEQLDALTYPRIEVLVVDDGSTDGSHALLDDLSASRPYVQVLRTGSAQGVAAARNRALSEASGTYVWFTDCDDEWSPDIVTRLVTEAELRTADVVLCDAVRVSGAEEHLVADASGDVADGLGLLTAVLEGRVKGHLWNKLFRRDALGTAPFPGTRAHSDLCGVLRVAPGAVRVAHVAEPLYRYKVRPGSILHSREYRWTDLPTCLEVAREVVGSLPPADRRDVAAALDVFAVRSVHLPLAHEVFRRNGPAAVLRRARDGIRQALARGPVRVARRLGPTTTARAAAVGVAPEVYGAAYRRYRTRRWHAVDTLGRAPDGVPG